MFLYFLLNMSSYAYEIYLNVEPLRKPKVIGIRNLISFILR